MPPTDGTPIQGTLNQGAPNRRSPIRGSSNRGLIVTLLVSLGLHLAALIVVLLLLHTGVPVADGPERPTEVELVMEEHKGDLRPTVKSPQSPAEARPEAEHPTETQAPPVRTPIETKAETPAAAEPAMAPDPEPELDAPLLDSGLMAKPTPAAAPAKESDPAPKHPTAVPEATAGAQSTPQAAQPGLTVTLGGTDSPSDARAWGDRIIPATPDAVFHNRPPEYPAEAALNGEQGTVILMIHVSPAGSTAGVDVLRSSGYALLDRAARDAVLRWRFLPAVKDGQAVASDMRMGFVFDVR
jgi:periplasmic protein TonB